MTSIKTSMRSLIAVGSGAAVMFISAYALDNFAQTGSALAVVVGADLPYFGLGIAAAAGFLVARIAPSHREQHSVGLAGLFVLTCAAQSGTRLISEPWWAIVFGELVPVLSCVLAICLGGLLQRFLEGHASKRVQVV